MVVVHFREHVDRIGIESEIGGINHPKGIQLVAESALSKHELCCIGPVKAVHTICSTEAILHRHCRTQWILVLPALQLDGCCPFEANEVRAPVL